MIRNPLFIRTAMSAAVLAFAASSAWAGRPLTVDDANTNAKGDGHVETWVSHAPGATVFNIAPAYAPDDGLEIAATLSRDTSEKVTATTVQMKYLFTKPDADGCNVGATVGATHTNHEGGTARFINGLATCNGIGGGSLHLNLGVLKEQGSAAVPIWGIAFEREFGSLTPHVEVFGQRHEKPTFQIGARQQVGDGIQLDGTIGRQAGNTVYSIGLKFQF